MSENAPPVPKPEMGGRFVSDGFIQIFNRIKKHSWYPRYASRIAPNLCNSFLRADMDVLHLQAMLGHASLDMVQHYAQMVDDDLLQAHKAHSPIDNLSRLKEGRCIRKKSQLFHSSCCIYSKTFPASAETLAGIQPKPSSSDGEG
ncbi:MAG: hypothetical protein MZU91_02165 [Desulfosudis oleivorans]|nr:hypothetical protein [Desulfosudis oleivorans]